MYSSDNKQYIIKQSSGQTYNFYYDVRKGICYSILTRRNSWLEPVTLQPKAHKLFYAEVDASDNIHILFQDLQGNIFISILNNGNMKTIPLLNSKSPKVYNKNLSLIPLKNCTHFFYVLQHNENYILTHQTLSGETISTPKAVDYISKDSSQYSAIYDSTGTIYIFYQTSSGAASHIGYKKYTVSNGSWSEFIPVTSHNNCEHPKTLIDARNIVHICYLRKSNNQYELVYQQKIPGKNIWTSDTVVYRSVYSIENSSICISNNTIILFWVNDDAVYYSTSVNEGSAWSKPARYSFTYGRQLFCMHYRSNNILENSKFIADDLPGNFINGFKLAFSPDEHTGIPNYISPNEKSVLFQNLQTIKGDIDDIRDYKSEVNEKLHKNISTLHELEKELTKLQVKISYFEGEINKLKPVLNKFGAADIPVNNNRSPDIESEKNLSTFKKLINSEENINRIKQLINTEIKENGNVKAIKTDIANLQTTVNMLENRRKLKLSKNQGVVKYIKKGSHYLPE